MEGDYSPVVRTLMCRLSCSCSNGITDDDDDDDDDDDAVSRLNGEVSPHRDDLVALGDDIPIYLGFSSFQYT